ncbi:CinA family protein [bacterium]|nr:CinA family protein [bacterium]
MNTTLKKIISHLINLKLSICTCESMTGGLLASYFTDIDNSSKVFKGSIVVYGTNIKMNLVKVTKDLIDKYGTISQECANSMASNIQRIFASDLAISVTGNASLTGPVENKPAGLAYVTIYVFDKKHEFCFKSEIAKTRQEIKHECCFFIFEQL